MNADLYNTLSPELQSIVDECGQRAAQNQRIKEREQDQTILKKWEDAGITVTELTPEAVEEFKKAAQPCYDDFADKLTPELIAAFTKD